MKMNRTSATTLAHEMISFYKEYDPYEFNDVVENEEQETENLVTMLLENNKTRIESILHYFKNIVDEGDKEDVQSANKIINTLIMYV